MSPIIDGKFPKSTDVVDELLPVSGPVEAAGSEVEASAAAAAAVESVSASLEHAESAEDRSHRLSVATLMLLVSALLFFMATKARGTAVFALSDESDSVVLPRFSVPAVPTVIVCAVICIIAAAGLFLKAPPKVRVALNVLAGLALLVGFLSWAAGDRAFPFYITAQLNGSLALAVPLIFGALGGLIGERSGVVNVAVEAQFLSGAFAAALVGTMVKNAIQAPCKLMADAMAASECMADAAPWAISAAMAASMVMGLLMAALLALFTVKYLVDQVVMGVVMNLFATGLTGYLYQQFVNSDRETYNFVPTMSRISVPGLSEIPFIGPILFQQKPLTYIAFGCVVLVWFLLFRTKWGLRVRSVGEHPEAAETVGINVRATRWQAVLVGGLFAGLGGSYFIVMATGQFVRDISSGLGFVAIATFIMGRWRPGLSLLMALFFGFVSQLTIQMQSLNTGLDGAFLSMLPYVATVVAVAGLVGRVVAPAADGTNYVK
ncbi:MAG: ABC transporter permease [Propionibacteriaceae bacterium]|jgi:simple sugar transport system permease protein|nr:ABC transporter permease [Propionibacteriaceae bacterium]